MKNICEIEFIDGSKEELLPGLAPDFPYIASHVEFDSCIDHFVPWHWHKEVELFYIDNGALEYHTQRGKMVFPAGSAGLVNSNVLHSTKPRASAKNTIQSEHIFDTDFIGGQQGGRIEQKYITPLVTATQIEIIALYPESPRQVELIDKICGAFKLCDGEHGYELRLRAVLSEIWCGLFELAAPIPSASAPRDKANDRIKLMLIYIHEHYAEKISSAELAAAAFISERECFRAFSDCLHTTPVQYLQGYRLRAACHLLARTADTMTSIAYACGLGSGSYFGRVFQAQMGCTPMEYRRRWQNNDMSGQE